MSKGGEGGKVTGSCYLWTREGIWVKLIANDLLNRLTSLFFYMDSTWLGIVIRSFLFS